MPDYRTMFDTNDLRAWDLDGKDVTLTIQRVTPGTVKGRDGKSNKKPIIHFYKTDRTLVLNKTNGKTIAGMYGPRVESWVGKRITVFPTQTTFGGETVDCVRVRPRVPEAPRKGAAKEEEPPAFKEGDPPPRDYQIEQGEGQQQTSEPAREPGDDSDEEGGAS